MGGILSPTAGEIRVRGRIASLLELGAGFHPDLTGRENVFLNASILGMSRRDIEARFDDIVAFAELEQFIDEQVKHYSSGMYVRLGFAVAINVEPDVLLVDEVLSVGDEAFQQKCLDRVRGFQHDGRTIIFVSHAADLVRRICNRVMVLDHGETIAIDDPASAILLFRERLMGEHLEGDRVLSHGHRITRTVRIEEVDISWPGSEARRSLSPGEPVTVAVRYECDAPTADVSFALAVRDTADITVYGCNSDVLGQPMGGIEGTGWVTFEIPAFNLRRRHLPHRRRRAHPRRRHGVRLRARSRSGDRGGRQRCGGHRRPRRQGHPRPPPLVLRVDGGGSSRRELSGPGLDGGLDARPGAG